MDEVYMYIYEVHIKSNKLSQQIFFVLKVIQP